MNNHCKQWAMTTLFLSAATAPATAQNSWSEDFESYAPGATIGGVNGWVGFGGLQAVVCTTQAQSGTQSLCQTQGAESLASFDPTSGFPLIGANAGPWQVTGSGFAESAGAGPTYFILLNEYSPAGPFEWSVQFFMDGNVISCDCGTNGTLSMPMASDVWLQFQIDIDFDMPDPLGNPVNGVATISYDDGTNSGTFPSYAWASGIFGTNTHPDSKIDALNLYPNGITSTFYWDDLEIRQRTVGNSLCSGLPNSTGNVATLTAFGSDSVSDTDCTFRSSDLPLNAQGIIFYGVNLGQTFVGDGIRCVFGTIQRFRLGNAAGPLNGNSPGVFIADAFDPTQNTQANLALAAGTLYFQLWYRDPTGPLGSGFNFSSGVEITFAP